jgi:hypothetical protein
VQNKTLTFLLSKKQLMNRIKREDDVISISSSDEEEDSPKRRSRQRSILDYYSPSQSTSTSLPGSCKEMSIVIDEDDEDYQQRPRILEYEEEEDKAQVVEEQLQQVETQHEEEKQLVEQQEGIKQAPGIQVIVERRKSEDATPRRSSASNILSWGPGIDQDYDLDDEDDYQEEYLSDDRSGEKMTDEDYEETSSSEVEEENYVPGFLKADQDSYSEWENPSDTSSEDESASEKSVSIDSLSEIRSLDFLGLIEFLYGNLQGSFAINVQNGHESLKCILLVPRNCFDRFIYLGILCSSDLTSLYLFSGELPNRDFDSFLLSDYRMLRIIQSKYVFNVIYLF